MAKLWTNRGFKEVYYLTGQNHFGDMTEVYVYKINKIREKFRNQRIDSIQRYWWSKNPAVWLDKIISSSIDNFMFCV